MKPLILVLDAPYYEAFTQHVQDHYATSTGPCIRSRDLYDNWHPGREQRDLLVDDNGFLTGAGVRVND